MGSRVYRKPQNRVRNDKWEIIIKWEREMKRRIRQKKSLLCMEINLKYGWNKISFGKTNHNRKTITEEMPRKEGKQLVTYVHKSFFKLVEANLKERHWGKQEVRKEGSKQASEQGKKRTTEYS